MAAINRHLNHGQTEDQWNNILQPKPAERNDDPYIAKILSDQYHQGFIKLISKRRPGLMGQIETLLSPLQAGHQRRPLSETSFGFLIRFGDMQGLYMRSLHAKLISMAVRVQKNGSSKGTEEALEGLDQFGTKLKKYICAVQNHEYMAKFTLEPNDPFIATSQRHNDHVYFQTALLNEGLNLEDLIPSQLSPASRDPNVKSSKTQTRDGETEDERCQRESIERLLKASIPAGPWEQATKAHASQQPASSTLAPRQRRSPSGNELALQ